ncbi:MAG: YaiO family outer membrane beta-barrel protein [Nitrospirota bacterium]
MQIGCILKMPPLRHYIGILVLSGFLLVPASMEAAENGAPLKNRIELSASHEYLSPFAEFGDWQTLSAAWYRKERPDLTWFVQMQGFTRNEGTGLLGTIGAYKDWTDSFYTYSAFSAGTRTVFLPQVRYDQDFSFKMGKEKNIVWLVGGTYIQYFDEHRDYILSTGLTIYMNKWITEYRIFRNVSEPGWIESFSHLVSITYGEEGKNWTTATASYGKQAYLAIQQEAPSSSVKNNSLLLSLHHRKWLGSDWGVFGELSYFNLYNTYQKGGLVLGVFKEF